MPKKTDKVSDAERRMSEYTAAIIAARQAQPTLAENLAYLAAHVPGLEGVDTQAPAQALDRLLRAAVEAGKAPDLSWRCCEYDREGRYVNLWKASLHTSRIHNDTTRCGLDADHPALDALAATWAAQHRGEPWNG